MYTGGLVAVTGATGHLGNVLVRALLEEGARVRVLMLPGEKPGALEGLPVEMVEGDVRDADSLRRAFEGAALVYHLAAVVSILPRPDAVLHAVNVRGTQNVVQACEACGVGRLVYVSSSHALVEPPHGTAVSEAMGSDPSRIVGPYGQSKAQATLEVLQAAQRGLDAVVVYPTGIVGPHDYAFSEMGRVVLDFAQRRIPAYVDGAYDFVDVRDVAAGMIAAARQGRRGEGYLLSGEHTTVSNLFAMMASHTGVPAPRLKIPMWSARMAAMFTPGLARVAGTKPRFTSYSLYVIRSNGLMDNTKAREELGYQPRPLHDAVGDAVAWFRDAGHLRG